MAWSDSDNETDDFTKNFKKSSGIYKGSVNDATFINEKPMPISTVASSNLTSFDKPFLTDVTALGNTNDRAKSRGNAPSFFSRLIKQTESASSQAEVVETSGKCSRLIQVATPPLSWKVPTANFEERIPDSDTSSLLRCSSRTRRRRKVLTKVIYQVKRKNDEEKQLEEKRRKLLYDESESDPGHSDSEDDHSLEKSVTNTNDEQKLADENDHPVADESYKYVYPQLHKLAAIMTSNDISKVSQMPDIELEGDIHNRIFAIPHYIGFYLRDDQCQGASFMYEQIRLDKGCVLNDDMGVGKTIQVIALLATLYRKTGTVLDRKIIQYKNQILQRRFNAGVFCSKLKDSSTESEELIQGLRSLFKSEEHDCDPALVIRPTLLLVPASLTSQWAGELNTWGCFDVVDYQSLSGPGASANVDDGIQVALECGSLEILLMSYDCFRRLSQEKRKPGSKQICTTPTLDLINANFDMVILDEMHMLRSDKSSLYASVYSLTKIKRRVGLTGTIFQNNYKELFSLLNLISPGILGTYKQFKESYSEPIMKSRQKNVSDTMIQLGQMRSQLLREKISTLVLRRDKSTLQNRLPRKTVFDLFLGMTPVQSTLYEQLRKTVEFRSLIAEVPFSELKQGNLWRSQHPSLENCANCPTCISFPLLAKLKKLVNHVDLLRKREASDSSNSDDTIVTIKERRAYEDAFSSEVLGSCEALLSNLDETQKSQKVVVLLKLLQICQERNNKVLVFSHSTEMLDIIQAILIQHRYRCERLDGTMNRKQREISLMRFRTNMDSFIFLISTKAGGIGLNLTTADVVINLDLSWNPSYDLQSQDRAFRIGQTKDVEVFRLFSYGTIEQQIFVRQIYKLQLSRTSLENRKEQRFFDGIQGSKTDKGDLFGIKNLLQVDEEKSREILHALANEAEPLGTTPEELTLIARLKDVDVRTMLKNLGMKKAAQ